jgi:hypothetical protein
MNARIAVPLVLSAVGGLLLLAATAAHGEGTTIQRCNEPAALAADIGRVWGETLLWTGTSNRTGVTAQLFVSVEKGNWTAVRVEGSRACIVDAGVLGSKLPVVGDPA